MKFQAKVERDYYVNKIKEDGLEATLCKHMHGDWLGEQLLALLFSVAFDRLSDEDYEALVLEVCENIEWEEE